MPAKPWNGWARIWIDGDPEINAAGSAPLN
jgi:hypothetical protein